MKKLLPLFFFYILAHQGFSQCYTVSQITYAPDSFNVGIPVLMIDDQFSGAIQMPFSFCFYGIVYNQLIIGSNGYISFDTSFANLGCQWNISTMLPSPSIPRNCVFFPMQDLYWDSISTYSFYNIYGTAPNRRFVVSMYHVPMYGCFTTKTFTGEVMLYEATNVIEIHTQLKELCSSWNGGYAIEGIQNANGTQASVVPGRNAFSQWTAASDARRFSPNCCPLGVEDNVDQTLLNIFPNPASNEVRISYANVNAEKFSVELVDVSGRIIYSDNFSAQNERIINPNVPAGIYFVHLVNENGETLATRKLAIE